MCKQKTKKAFSIGEVMVAMFILLFGIISAVFLTARSINSIGDSRNAAIASALAQEGTELVRNVRDNNVTQEVCGDNSNERCTAFDDATEYGWPSPTLGREGVWCVIDYDISSNKLNCSSPFSKSDALYINKDTGFYTISGGNNFTTPFRRRIYIKYDLSATGVAENPNDQVATVTSVVLWKDGEFPTDVGNIESECKIAQGCAFAQTRLTSWINYGD